MGNGPGYTGCHKYVPFAGFPNRRTFRVQRIEIITSMTTAMLFFLFRTENLVLWARSEMIGSDVDQIC